MIGTTLYKQFMQCFNANVIVNNRFRGGKVMKKQIRIAILLTLAVVVLATTALLGACSSKTPDYAPSTPDSGKEQVYIRNDYLNLAAKQKDLAVVLDKITELAQNNDAVLISRESNSTEKGLRNAMLKFSLPNEKADAFVAAIKTLDCKVESERYNVDNVTNRYNTDQAQIAALQYKLDEYTKLQDEAGLTQEDKISLINQIADIKMQLERINSDDNVVTDRTTVSIYMYPNDIIDAGAVVGTTLLFAVFATAIFFVIFLSVKTEKQRRTINSLRTQVTALTKTNELK